MDQRPLLVLTGTTASGKNRVGTWLAQQLGGEVLSLDSMKVYRGMDVGTDKPSLELRAAVPHHMVDVIDASESMNIRRYVDLARGVEADVRARGRLPIVVGGTALYLNGYLWGLLEGPEADPEFRAALKLEAAELGLEALHARLATIDPATAARVHQNDYRRIERALEVFATTGEPISRLQGQWAMEPPTPRKIFVLTWDRSVLDHRIDSRVDLMFQNGLVDEVERLMAAGGLSPEASQALGYREVLAMLAGELSSEEARSLIKSRTRRFARRQMTWFRRWKEAEWIVADPDADVPSLGERILSSYRELLSGR